MKNKITIIRKKQDGGNTIPAQQAQQQTPQPNVSYEHMMQLLQGQAQQQNQQPNQEQLKQIFQQLPKEVQQKILQLPEEQQAPAIMQVYQEMQKQQQAQSTQEPQQVEQPVEQPVMKHGGKIVKRQRGGEVNDELPTVEEMFYQLPEEAQVEIQERLEQVKPDQKDKAMQQLVQQYQMQQYEHGGKIKIAKSTEDYKTGMKKGDQEMMIFPFNKHGKKQMTMEGMTVPLAYFGYDHNNKLVDKGIALPGQKYNVNGKVVVEKRLPNFQAGGKTIEELIREMYNTSNEEPQTQDDIVSYPKGNEILNPYQYFSNTKNLMYTPSEEYDMQTVPSSEALPYSTKPFDVTSLNLPSALFNSNTPFSLLSGNKPDSSLDVINNSFDNPQGSTPKEKDNKKSNYNVHPGNILQTLPLNATYNLGKYLFDKPEVETPIYNPNAGSSLSILKNLRASFDMTPIMLADATAKQNIKDNVTSSSSRTANLLQQDLNKMKAIREGTYQNQATNNQYSANYANALNNEGLNRQGEKIRIVDNNQRNKAAHDSYLGTAMKEYDNTLGTIGEVLNQNELNSQMEKLLKDRPGDYEYDENGRLVLKKKAMGGYVNKLRTYLNSVK